VRAGVREARGAVRQCEPDHWHRWMPSAACRQGRYLGFIDVDVPARRLCCGSMSSRSITGMADAAHAAASLSSSIPAGTCTRCTRSCIGWRHRCQALLRGPDSCVAEFKKQYGRRITPLGRAGRGLICRSDESALRAYTRKASRSAGRTGLLGTRHGNSLTDYMPGATTGGDWTGREDHGVGGEGRRGEGEREEKRSNRLGEGTGGHKDLEHRETRRRGEGEAR